ncbi:MarR family transcriptional regulator [Actinoplanes sp. NBC_00393]|uniref:MarR family winged helix-turn-helix transcriptional regulator n=1 Tax=Actinoplanes sp. NBC_00393 TaxID=2975953 RepID=UPI002E21EA1A
MSEAKRLGRSRTRLLSQVATRSDRLVNEALAEVDARKWHYAVLATLEEFGPASQAELSERTRIYRSDLVAVINELTARGEVERAPDPSDRRRNVITLTTAGGRRLAALDRILADVEEQLLAPLSPADRDELTRLLATLAEHHGARW